MSTNTFIGAAGKSWTNGLSWFVGGVVLTALAATSWFVVAPRFVPLTKKYHSLTVADFAGSLYSACFVPVIILGLFQKRRGARAAKLSMILGASTVVIAFALNNAGVISLSEVYPGMIVGTVSFIVASSSRFGLKSQTPRPVN